MELTVNKKVESTTTTLELIGMLDITTANVIEPYLDEINDIATLIIDFSKLDFIDSTGIGAIMNAIYLSQEKNYKIILQGINELTHHVFETVGLYRILDAVQGEVS
ncbi:STAS domain-containing protein [Bacillus sp. JJ1503]|uniref:STAS domain-containing protein n=1 Tax=Bacillus sp. JJ1503 TaxID=3122956 RepID=UPI002FFE8EA7